jgi:hypothetical protein
VPYWKSCLWHGERIEISRLLILKLYTQLFFNETSSYFYFRILGVKICYVLEFSLYLFIGSSIGFTKHKPHFFYLVSAFLLIFLMLDMIMLIKRQSFRFYNYCIGVDWERLTCTSIIYNMNTHSRNRKYNVCIQQVGNEFSNIIFPLKLWPLNHKPAQY